MQFRPVLSLLILGVFGSGVVSLIASGISQGDRSTMYLSLSATNRDMKDYTEGFLEGLPSKIGHYKWLVVDTQTTSSIKNIYSSPPKESAIDEVIDSLPEQATAEDALLHSLDRVIFLAEQHGNAVYAVIVTEGTQKPSTLQALRTRAETLKTYKGIRLFVAGVKDENRVRLAEAFKPIGEQVWFAGCGDTERVQLLNQL